ncbi:MAG: hypothetical protein GY757_05715 [bacterium]|nr:hypothetical protein [bacterium]
MHIRCSNTDCDNTIHSFRLKYGKRFGGAGSWEEKDERWYCCRKCFFEIYARQFIESRRSGIKKSIHRVKLGLILLKNGLVDKETLSMALEVQNNSFKKLGEILVDTGKITAKELKSVLSMQAGVAPLNLAPDLKVSLKDEIPLRLIREYPFVCFRSNEEEHIIGIAIYDLELLPVLREILMDIYPGFLIKFYLDDKQNLLSVLEKNYPKETFVTSEHAILTGGDGGNLEILVYKIVDFLNQCGAKEVDVDEFNHTVRLKTTVSDLDITVDLKDSKFEIKDSKLET